MLVDGAQYLNRRRAGAGVSLIDFAEAADVTDNAAQDWLYEGARPADNHLVGIAAALASDDGADEHGRALRELRRLYWVSDVAEVLAGFIGVDAVDEVTGRLHWYSSLLYAAIDQKIDAAVRSDVLGSLAAIGAHSEFSGGLLAVLIPQEPDAEWQKGLAAAASNWTRRVLAVNLEVHRAEVDALIQDTDGQVLRDWDVSNPEAYAHYRCFGELQLQGRMHAAIAEVEMAAKLDPLDPANHFTLGSYKGGIGAKLGNAAMVQEGIEACWIAAALDQNWVLPWAEIGFILLQSGRPEEAAEHLRAIPPERRPFDTRYYSSLGAALRETGRFAESLDAFEASLELNPEDPPVVEAAAIAAALCGDKVKSTRHARTARYLGASEEFHLRLEFANAIRTHMPNTRSASKADRQLAALDAAIKRNPQDVTAFLYRGRLYFERRDEGQAIADLDEALRLNPDSRRRPLLKRHSPRQFQAV